MVVGTGVVASFVWDECGAHAVGVYAQEGVETVLEVGVKVFVGGVGGAVELAVERGAVVEGDCVGWGDEELGFVEGGGGGGRCWCGGGGGEERGDEEEREDGRRVDSGGHDDEVSDNEWVVGV